MGTVPGTPTTLSGMNATALRKIAWDKKLRENSIRPSVFEQLKTACRVVDDHIMKDVGKSGVMLEIMAEKGSSAQSRRLAMDLPLTKAPQLGTGETVLGNEDESSLLWAEVYYNEIKKGIKYKKWGYDYNDTSYLGFVEKYNDRLSTFMAEYRDYRIQHSLTLTYGPELTKTPVSKTQQFNKNWVVPNLLEASQPAWDLTDLTVTDGSQDTDNYYSSQSFSGATSFVENIAAALVSGAGTGSTPNNKSTIDAWELISYMVSDSYLLTPIMLDGIPSYIVVLPSRVKHWMNNPNNTGSLGAHFQAVAQYKDPTRQTIVGEIGRVFEKFVFVTNHRAPTLKVSGSAGSYSLQPGFVMPGNNDDRNNSAWSNTSGSTNYVHDLAFVLGEDAIAEYLVDPLVTNLQESTEYGQIQGRAAYLGEGMQLLKFDKDTAGQLDGSSTTQVQKGSAVIPFGRVPLQTIS